MHVQLIAVQKRKFATEVSLEKGILLEDTIDTVMPWHVKQLFDLMIDTQTPIIFDIVTLTYAIALEMGFITIEEYNCFNEHLIISSFNNCFNAQNVRKITEVPYTFKYISESRTYCLDLALICPIKLELISEVYKKLFISKLSIVEAEEHILINLIPPTLFEYKKGFCCLLNSTRYIAKDKFTGVMLMLNLEEFSKKLKDEIFLPARALYANFNDCYGPAENFVMNPTTSMVLYNQLDTVDLARLSQVCTKFRDTIKQYININKNNNKN